MYYRGAILFSKSFLPVIAKEYMGYIKALKNVTRKCIVLDLDNVLWGGILGEDGFSGIKLGNDPVGRAYVDFQRLLLSYYNRGIILAINSKNNFDEAIKVIREHPNMILREKNFASMRINWQDKVENMLELSSELNIGLDSMVSIDDSPQERERMKQALPEVLVVDLPSNATATLTFDWTPMAVAVYRLKVEVTVLPDETYPADNNVTCSVAVKVKMVGDVNGDGCVDIGDIAMAALAYGSYPCHPRWNNQADVNRDGRVDIQDLAVIAQRFGSVG